MEFFTVSKEKRPVRLSDATRRFAYESLYDHRYGLDTRRVMSVPLDDIDGISELSDLKKYNAAIRRIAESAPIRICDGELISGAATLGLAISHVVPATIDGRPVFGSVSHLTLDFVSVLRDGVVGLYDKIEKSMSEIIFNSDLYSTRRLKFLASCKSCLDSMLIWRDRYINALEAGGYHDNADILRRVPFEPASNFREAVQSLWFTFAFVRLCGNWPGIGRIDMLLGEYLERDLADGKITLDEARELLAHFFIKGCEWVSGGDYGSGDAQHYQNILLGGIDENDNSVECNVTYLVLDIIDELGISDFPITVRISPDSSDELLYRVANTIRYGGGIIALYNEPLIIDALTKFGYDEREAKRFANDGCWEVQIPGKTYFIYTPFDSLAILQHTTLADYKNRDFADFDALYDAYVRDLKAYVEGIGRGQLARFETERDPDGRLVWRPTAPCTVVSLFEQGCIERGYSYFEGGPVYNVISPHIGGLADTVNSLYAIKKAVFDEGLLGLDEFFDILAADWDESEPLRQHMLTAYRYFGNDNPEVDSIYSKLLSDFSDICHDMEQRLGTNCGYRFPSGVSTFGRQLEWAPNRLASPHGHRAHEVLAPNCSPTPGSDREGATAIIRSYAAADLTKQVTGAALDIKLLPDSVDGDEGLDAIVGLMRGFVTLGGFFMQPDVADASILRDAQAHPENYQALSVRVSGWNARFVTLNCDWQNMIIAELEGKV
ncbi:MAG TPA: hypothetical protein H9681_13095 [Firmicutes bacterium]|nr:hypothetical protein [Bacillota bacterium]